MKQAAAAAVLALVTSAACGQTTVTDAWVRGTVAQQTATGLFANITSVQGGRLLSVSSPLAGAAELHRMAMEGNTMHMGAVSGGLELPAGKPVQLQPGGLHVMLLDLKRQLKAGDMVPLTLVVEGADKKRETLELKVPVRALGR